MEDPTSPAGDALYSPGKEQHAFNDVLSGQGMRERSQERAENPPESHGGYDSKTPTSEAPRDSALTQAHLAVACRRLPPPVIARCRLPPPAIARCHPPSAAACRCLPPSATARCLLPLPAACRHRSLMHVDALGQCAKLTGCHPGMGPRSTEMLALLKAMPQNTCSSALDDMPHSPQTRLLGENRYLLSNSARRANRPDCLQRKRPITLATFSASSQLPWPLGARIWRAHRNVRTFDSAPPAGALRRGCQRTR